MAEQINRSYVEGTVVPNEGYVENVYFNTNLSNDEIAELHQSVVDAGRSEYGTVYLIAIKDASPLEEISMRKVDDNSYEIFANKEFPGMDPLLSGDGGYITIYSTETGWRKEIKYPIKVNSEVSNSAASGREVAGEYNHLLTSLFSITPFDSGDESQPKPSKKEIKRIYADAEEIYVKSTVFYVDGNMPYAYKEETLEHPVSKEELENAFLKGLFIGVVEEGRVVQYEKPLSIYKENSEEVEYSFVFIRVSQMEVYSKEYK